MNIQPTRSFNLKADRFDVRLTEIIHANTPCHSTDTLTYNKVNAASVLLYRRRLRRSVERPSVHPWTRPFMFAPYLTLALSALKNQENVNA